MLPSEGVSIFEAILAALAPLLVLVHILSIALTYDKRARAKQQQKDAAPPFPARSAARHSHPYKN
jgi:hypothetical protein